MPESPFSIGLRDVTHQRLAGIRRHDLTSTDRSVHRINVAVPASYGVKTKRRYPLLLLLNASDWFGSAVEMCRLMAQTQEIRECIVVSLETTIEGDRDVERHAAFIAGQLLSWCDQNYRVETGVRYLFSGLDGISEALERSVEANMVRPLNRQNDRRDDVDWVPTLVNGLRKHLGTGHLYGSELVILAHPLVSKALSALQPLFSRLSSKSPSASKEGEPHVIKAKAMGRDFEIFAVPPASAATNPARRYPTLLVLDANIELSIVAEAAAQLAQSGEIEEIMVIGIGTPRSEGMIEFGFRRFEEFAPPADGYRFDDHLGRVFRSLFATRGLDARQCVGKASQLNDFLIDELLPTLVQQLPIDESNLGVLGHSAGGTFVSYSLFQERSPFHRYAAISPGVGISGSWLMRPPQSTRSLAKAAHQVCFFVGGDEKSNRFCQIAGIPDTESLAQQMKNRGPSIKIHCQSFEGETHSTIYPRAVVQALRSFYPKASSRTDSV